MQRDVAQEAAAPDGTSCALEGLRTFVDMPGGKSTNHLAERIMTSYCCPLKQGSRDV